MRFRDGRLVRLEYHLRPIVVDMHCTQYQNEATECSVRRDGFQPIIIQVEQNHLRLCCLQYEVTKFLHLPVNNCRDERTTWNTYGSIYQRLHRAHKNHLATTYIFYHTHSGLCLTRHISMLTMCSTTLVTAGLNDNQMPFLMSTRQRQKYWRYFLIFYTMETTEKR